MPCITRILLKTLPPQLGEHQGPEQESGIPPLSGFVEEEHAFVPTALAHKTPGPTKAHVLC